MNSAISFPHSCSWPTDADRDSRRARPWLQHVSASGSRLLRLARRSSRFGPSGSATAAETWLRAGAPAGRRRASMPATGSAASLAWGAVCARRTNIPSRLARPARAGAAVGPRGLRAEESLVELGPRRLIQTGGFVGGVIFRHDPPDCRAHPRGQTKGPPLPAYPVHAFDRRTTFAEHQRNSRRINDKEKTATMIVEATELVF